MDQEIKQDAGKPRLSLVPTQILWDVAEVREWGVANKYKDINSWKGVEKQRIIDAAYRHFILYKDDTSSVAEDSRISHLKHCACNIAFLCDMEMRELEEIAHKGDQEAGPGDLGVNKWISD